MKVKASHLTELTVPNLEAFDLDPEFGLASLRVDGDDVAIYLNNDVLRSWTHEGYGKPSEIKWFSSDEVVTYPPVVLVSATGTRELERSCPYKFAVSDHYIFIAYNDEVIYSSRYDDPEANGASIYSREGGFELGFCKFFNKDRSADFVEIESCYCVGDTFVFTGDDRNFNKIWLLNVPARTYRSITTPFDLVTVRVMTGDEKKAYAIFDNRYSSQHYPDLPPFELAAFDLVAETAVKSSFAPVEAALLAAGFDPAAITLQPNARGRIIVSDATKAALLEFSDGD